MFTSSLSNVILQELAWRKQQIHLLVIYILCKVADAKLYDAQKKRLIRRIPEKIVCKKGRSSRINQLFNELEK